MDNTKYKYNKIQNLANIGHITSGEFISIENQIIKIGQILSGLIRSTKKL